MRHPEQAAIRVPTSRSSVRRPAAPEVLPECMCVDAVVTLDVAGTVRALRERFAAGHDHVILPIGYTPFRDRLSDELTREEYARIIFQP